MAHFDAFDHSIQLLISTANYNMIWKMVKAEHHEINQKSGEMGGGGGISRSSAEETFEYKVTPIITLLCVVLIKHRTQLRKPV